MIIYCSASHHKLIIYCEFFRSSRLLCCRASTALLSLNRCILLIRDRLCFIELLWILTHRLRLPSQLLLRSSSKRHSDSGKEQVFLDHKAEAVLLLLFSPLSFLFLSLSSHWFLCDMHFNIIFATFSILIMQNLLIRISSYFTKVSVEISSHFTYLQSQTQVQRFHFINRI